MELQLLFKADVAKGLKPRGSPAKETVVPRSATDRGFGRVVINPRALDTRLREQVRLAFAFCRVGLRDEDQAIS